jgi:hypothetical protein
MLDHAETAAAQPQTLRRAVAFIHDNAHRDIGLSDIAAAISVTPRSVQYTSVAISAPRRWSICAACASIGRTAICRPPTPPLTR